MTYLVLQKEEIRKILPQFPFTWVRSPLFRNPYCLPRHSDLRGVLHRKEAHGGVRAIDVLFHWL